MLTLHCLKEYPNIINKINYYLDPVFIKDNIKLSLINYPNYNKNFDYLIKNNVTINYALMYAIYPERTMPFLCELSKLISLNDAFEILMNIPFKTNKIYNIYNYNNNIIDDTVNKEIIKLITYNYAWAYVLIKRNINSSMIKNLLNNFYDFHFFELFNINNKVFDINEAYLLMINNLYYLEQYKAVYYKLRMLKIPHSIAYNLCKYDKIFIDKIIDISYYGYYDTKLLNIIIYFDEEQINFLKLARFGYDNIKEFNDAKNNIIENAFFEKIINPDENLLEPLSKKIKLI